MRPSKRDELVQKALKLFYRNGFHATGMDLLAAETGISKTSMYKYFRTKEDLILAALRLRDENFRNWMFRRMEEIGATPAKQMLAMYDVLAEWFGDPDYRGCLFIKASAEYQEAAHPIYAQAAEHKRLLFTHMSALAARVTDREPQVLARQFLLLKEGAIVTAHLRLSSDPAGEAKAAARVLLDRALV